MKRSKTMWKHGIIEMNGTRYTYEMKHFEEGSIFGINEGRISKLWISRKGKAVYNYDRGEDIAPADDETKAVLEEILKKYN